MFGEILQVWGSARDMNLPIYEIEDRIVSAVKASRRLVLQALMAGDPDPH